MVNCTGLGARTLCSDSNLTPIRGQVVRVKAPWLKIGVFADNDTYIIPSVNSVTLGGCRQYGDFNLQPSAHDSAGIWQRVTTLMPNLKKAQVITEDVGLRPHRGFIRVERETLTLPNDAGGQVLQVGCF